MLDWRGTVCLLMHTSRVMTPPPHIQQAYIHTAAAAVVVHNVKVRR